MATKYGNWIAGEATPPGNGDYLESTSPRTGELVALIPRGTAADIDRAVRAAEQAQAGWAALGPAGRGRVLQAIARAIRARRDEFSALESAETGKPNPGPEVDGAAEYFDFYGGVVRALHGETLDTGPGTTTFTRRFPFGVVGVITPWNGPLNQAARDVAPALAAGNTVVLKPSEFTSTTSLLMAEVAAGAGLPAGTLSVVTGLGPEAGAALVDHPGVRKVAFTGSVATGKLVGAAAAARVIPVTLELGGKSANVVFADADLKLAAAHVARGFTANTGQVCSAPTRLVVERAAHDELVDRVVEIVRGLDAGKELGPLITPPQFDKVQRYFEIAADEDAILRTGGSVVRDGELAQGLYVSPTVYTGVRRHMRIAQEEIFGPVLSVLAFDGEQEAIELANGVPYGLAASVWTSDVGRALRLADRLDAGQVSVNGAPLGVEAPFGGTKESGIGRVKGVEALRTYTQLKTISIKTS